MELFRRLPAFLSVLFVGFLLIGLTVIPYVVVNYEGFEIQKWYSYLFLLLPVIVYLVISYMQIRILKKPLEKLLKAYYKRLDKLISRLKEWQDNTIEKYEKLFVQKLEYENRKILERVYGRLGENRRKELYHQNRVKFLTKQAKDIARVFGIDVKTSYFEPSVDFNQAGLEVLDYALFREKRTVASVVIDIKKVIKDIDAYGYIYLAKLDKVLGRNDDI